MTPWSVALASPTDADGLAELFAQCSFGCHCQYWNDLSNSRDWLERCATAPEENERRMRAALSAGENAMRGFVARDAEAHVVGWLKCTAATAMDKLYEQRLYRALPCFDRKADGVLAIGCMLVAEPHRRRGVARALLAEAIRHGRQMGATCIEAFPRAEAHVSDAALMMGPVELYREAGFQIVNDFSPYPVMRKLLEPPEYA